MSEWLPSNPWSQHVVLAARQYPDEFDLASGDEWTLTDRPLTLVQGTVIDLGVQTTELVPITPDDRGTPGHDSEGVVECGGAPCDSVCCPGECAEFASCANPTHCDGPEDCGPQSECCATLSQSDGSIASQCVDASTCETLVACHQLADCPLDRGCIPLPGNHMGFCESP